MGSFPGNETLPAVYIRTAAAAAGGGESKGARAPWLPLCVCVCVCVRPALVFCFSCVFSLSQRRHIFVLFCAGFFLGLAVVGSWSRSPLPRP